MIDAGGGRPGGKAGIMKEELPADIGLVRDWKGAAERRFAG